MSPLPRKVDSAFLRQQVSMEQVLRHLGLFDQLRGRGLQRRGPCQIHGQPNDRQPTFSAHLGKHLFQCFHADCGGHGNVLDLWAALHKRPLYEAALHLAGPRNGRPKKRAQETGQETGTAYVLLAIGPKKRGQRTFCLPSTQPAFIISPMPRHARAALGGYCYHALNRGNARRTVFHKDSDYAAFARLLRQATLRTDMRLLAWFLMKQSWYTRQGKRWR